MTARQRIYGFFVRHGPAWEIFMVVLALAYVAMMLVGEFAGLDQDTLDVMDWADLGVGVFFLAEFLTRMLVSPSRRSYVEEHWLDLLAVLPLLRWLRVFAVFRLFSLFRLAPLARMVNSLDRVGLDVSRFLRFNGMAWVLLSLTLIMLAASGLLYYFESGVNPKILSYWDALYASLVTWSTPGYGDIMPVTAAGRICGLVLIIVGLLTWGILVANLASFLISKRDAAATRCDPAAEDCRQKLAHLDGLSRSELVALKGSVGALIDDKLNGYPPDSS
jgi:voltage-gated potassium channel